MPEFDSKRAKLREIASRNDIEEAASETGRSDAEPAPRPAKLKAAVVPLRRSGDRKSIGSNRKVPTPHGPDDDDPGPAAA